MEHQKRDIRLFWMIEIKLPPSLGVHGSGLSTFSIMVSG